MSIRRFSLSSCAFSGHLCRQKKSIEHISRPGEANIGRIYKSEKAATIGLDLADNAACRNEDFIVKRHSQSDVQMGESSRHEPTHSTWCGVGRWSYCRDFFDRAAERPQRLAARPCGAHSFPSSPKRCVPPSDIACYSMRSTPYPLPSTCLSTAMASQSRNLPPGSSKLGCSTPPGHPWPHLSQDKMRPLGRGTTQ